MQIRENKKRSRRHKFWTPKTLTKSRNHSKKQQKYHQHFSDKANKRLFLKNQRSSNWWQQRFTLPKWPTTEPDKSSNTWVRTDWERTWDQNERNGKWSWKVEAAVLVARTENGGRERGHLKDGANVGFK